ncbi:natural killer cell receptor 2B4-like [Alligator mississippiensis]|uniref:Natural killer cell receptor 2B4-like n=1 Tax=Alligator mississippiensis TaxID=8496 RepID=A0A151NC95_ALLMI|nr:natural killer cell receptor 2B4-like [Alligator mississippiensis]
MKELAELKSLLTLLSSLPFKPPGCQEVKVVAAVGETVQLHPKTWPPSWVTVNWILIVGSQTYWILRHDQNRTSANPLLPFADRVSFHPGNLSLQINSVTEKESGLYTMDLMLGDGSGITNNFRLFVLDRVQQPNIKASTSQECGWCYLTLSCLVPKADRVTYSWSQGASSSPAPEDHWLQQHQADLQVEITKSDNTTFYHCNVSNAISWGMATIDVKMLCNYTNCQEVKVVAAVGETFTDLLDPQTR